MSITEEWKKRCDWCGWPLHVSPEDGCSADNCSMRPRPNNSFAEFKQRIRKQAEAAKDLDQMLLRCFDAGMLDQAIREGCCGFDPWGTLADFREAFGLPPMMTPEQWARSQTTREERPS